jgi:hypothetical protein
MTILCAIKEDRLEWGMARIVFPIGYLRKVSLLKNSRAERNMRYMRQ